MEDAALAGLIGAGIGAITGVASSSLAAWHQTRLERERARAARADELSRAERDAMLDLMRLLATATHAIEWLAWAATAEIQDVFRQEMDAYNTRMRELLPQLVAAEVAAASLSDDAFERIDPLINDLLALDQEVGTAGAQFEIRPADAVGRIAAVKQPANDLAHRSVHEVRALLRRAVT